MRQLIYFAIAALVIAGIMPRVMSHVGQNASAETQPAKRAEPAPARQANNYRTVTVQSDRLGTAPDLLKWTRAIRGGRILSETYWRYRANNYTDFTSLVITNAITGAAALFRRELAERALPFPPPHGDIFHDHWLALVAMATGDIRYVDRPLYDYVQHSMAALGFSKANAGRGRWGGWLADIALRMLRLASRVIRPVGQVRYFENFCRLVLMARGDRR